MSKSLPIHIGNRSTFSIRYVPGWATTTEKNSYAYLNISLGGQIIGNPNEAVFVPTWTRSLKEIPNQIQKSMTVLDWEFIKELSTIEQFEILNKSNQLVQEYSIQYQHLRVLDHSYWVNARLQFDETIDNYSIFMIPYNENIKFIWKNISDKKNNIKSIVDSKQNIKSTVVNFQQTIDKYLYYKRGNTQDNNV